MTAPSTSSTVQTSVLASLNPSLKSGLLSQRIATLIGTVQFIVEHCDDVPLAAAIDLLAVGLEQLQEALTGLVRGECNAGTCKRIRRLLHALFNACAHFDRECVNWPEIAGVVRLVTFAMNEVHDELFELVHHVDSAEILQGTSSLHC